MAAPVAEQTTRDPRDRAWLLAAAVVAGVAVVVRAHNLVAYPPLYDYDGPGHALSVLAIHRGALPDPNTWSGFHPPLAYALGAALWTLLPTSVPVHVGLRAISCAATLAMAAVVGRALTRFVPPADAAVATIVLLCSPVVTIAGAMLGNEALCAAFVTVALARTTAIPRDAARAPAHAAITALWLALGLVTKSTALGAVAVVAPLYAWRLRRTPAHALAAGALVAVIPAIAIAPHALRMMRASGGSPLALVSGAALTPEVRAEMRTQPPGERHLADYVTIPAATFLAPEHRAPGLERSVPGLLYASVFADGHGQFLPADRPAVLAAAAALSIAGLVPTALAALGLARVLRAPRRFAAAAGPFLLAAALLVAFLRYTWVLPAYSAVKASYLLPAALPAALLLALGLASLAGAFRTAARGYGLAFGLSCSVALWQGWWA